MSSGGTCAAMRAISVGHTLGFRNFKLYGFDCSVPEPKDKDEKDCNYCKKYEKLKDWPKSERPIAFRFNKVPLKTEILEKKRRNQQQLNIVYVPRIVSMILGTSLRGARMCGHFDFVPIDLGSKLTH